MDAPVASHEALLAQISNWAMAERNVRFVAIIGSRARQQDPADEWSDIDVLLAARRPGVYLADGQWLSQLGEVWLNHVVRSPVGGTEEQRAVFDGGIEVDFVVLPARTLKLASLVLQIISRVPAAAHLMPRSLRGRLGVLADVFGRGSKVLVDKDGLMSRPLSVELDLQPSTRPSQDDFVALAHGFWHGAIWVAKHLRRGELWRAKDGCDARMKASILQLAEWHTKATRGWSFDTWAQGRFLERWADPRILAALGGTFGHYDTEDVWRALFATIALFRWLGRDTATKLDLAYPAYAEECANAWVERCFSERAATVSADAARIITPSHSA